MNEQLKNRLNIILNFNQYSGKPELSFQKQFTRVKLNLVIVGYVFLSVAYSLRLSLLFLFNEDSSSEVWQGADFTVVFAFIFTLLVFNYITDFILYRHAQKITKQSFEIKEEWNTDLRKVLNKLRDRRRNFVHVIPTLVLTVAALLHSLELNPEWDSFAYLVPVCTLLFLAKLSLDIRLLFRNLKNVRG